MLGARQDEAEADTQAEDEIGGGRKHRRVDHSTAGAQHAFETLPPLPGCMLAYIIAGHHGRLPDWEDPGSTATLPERLKKTIEPLQPVEPHLLKTPPPEKLQPTWLKPAPDRNLAGFQLAFHTRMLYAALVDADRLETEKFCDPNRAKLRRSYSTGTAELLEQLDCYIDTLRADRRGAPAPVDHHRDAVLAACREKAALPPGLYSLTVPTGGGKTLASLAFALTHAHRHGLRRVIYALPFTSIIEQTAATFREIFDDGDVLEHHSNFDPVKQFDQNHQRIAYEMAAENFDAPVIVTTNVQLFESVFSARGSTCRKLHRLAGSVVILDEAQAIPPRLLKPVLAAIDELARNYRCTVVLCTATQPAITQRPDFPIGLPKPVEIVDEPEQLYHAMKRVDVHDLGAVDDDALVDRLADRPAALCIVNTRKHAAALTQLLIDRGLNDAIHLSAAMCPAHRKQLVARIKALLNDKRPCRVVSTQVIEAGVDVDFPAVYRALAGFDSIAQAAGRCNREGLQQRGDVFVFKTNHQPARSLQYAINAAANLWPDHRDDPLSLSAIEAYFRKAYWSQSHLGQKAWDTKDVLGCFVLRASASEPCAFNFRQADQRFQWIDSQTLPVLVPFGEAAGEGKDLLNQIRNSAEPDWHLLRRAEPYCVSVYAESSDFRKLRDNTVIEPCFDQRLWLLQNLDAYDHTLGLRTDVVGLPIDLQIA